LPLTKTRSIEETKGLILHELTHLLDIDLKFSGKWLIYEIVSPDNFYNQFIIELHFDDSNDKLVTWFDLKYESINTYDEPKDQFSVDHAYQFLMRDLAELIISRIEQYQITQDIIIGTSFLLSTAYKKLETNIIFTPPQQD